MESFMIFGRTLLAYFLVFFILRIMGKREIAKLSIFDLVISIMIAEIAVFIIEDPYKPIAHGVIPMITLVIVQILLAYLTMKSHRLRMWVDGRPSMIIKNGKLNEKEMKRQRYNLDDLMLQLRENRISNVADVEFAVLETTGKLTVFKKLPAEKQIPPKIRFEGLPLPLIMDGKVQDKNLEQIGKTRFWLKNQLQNKGVNDFKEIFFCSIDHQGKLFLDRKNRK